MYKLSENQKKKVLRDIYISNEGVVDFNRINDLYRDVLLIEGSCGRGKTTYALDLTEKGLLANINRRRKAINLFDKEYKDISADEVLFLTSRTTTKKQQVKAVKNVISAISADYQKQKDYDFTNSRKGKIRIATAHQFGGWVKKGLVEIPPKIIILDELHSLIAETIFAEDLLYTIDFVKEYYADMVKIGLTATPQFLYDYISTEDNILTFRTIDKELGSKYKVDYIKAYIRGSAESILKEKKKQISCNSKCIYYTQSAKECYRLAEEYGETASFLISDYNESKNDKGEYLVDIMKNNGIKDYIIENEKLPPYINIIFINSSCREGMNIKDDNVKIVICESADMITIQQILGRVRRDLKEFIIVANYRNKDRNDKNIKDLVSFIDSIENAESDSQKKEKYIYRYGQQDGNKNLQKYVYCYKGEYRLNQYAKAYLKYINESYIQISNTSYKHITQIADRQLLSSTDYIRQLERFTDNMIDIETVWKAVVETNHDNAIERFKAVESEWLNKPIDKEKKKELCAVFGAVRSGGKVASWKTIKDIMLDNGYIITEKRIGKERKSVSIITKG